MRRKILPQLLAWLFALPLAWHKARAQVQALGCKIFFSSFLVEW
jgi:hypothetical protein